MRGVARSYLGVVALILESETEHRADSERRQESNCQIGRGSIGNCEN